MAVRSVVAVLLLAGGIQTVFSQSISFNSPLPWVSLRNDTIVVRAQLDTVALKNKQLSLTLATVKNGKSSTIATKVFPVKDPSGEFSFGKINKKLIGGEEFLQVKWSIKGAAKGSEEKGSVEPIGIADLTQIATTDTVRASHVAEGATAKDAAAAAGSALVKTGSVSYALSWNKDALFAVVKKDGTKDSIKFAIDGKSGRNAFLSYPDRIINVVTADSAAALTVHYQRVMKNDSLVYGLENWASEAVVETVGDVVVVKVPWFSTGIIPFEGRTIGFGVFTVDPKGKPAAALPAGAQLFIPATWGTLQLKK
jgi:hypothetical protein